MKKSILLCIMVATVIFSGCSSSKEDNQGNTGAASANATQADSSASPADSSATTAPAKKKLSAVEKLALEYVEVFLNGSDLEAKKKFITDKMHPDVQPLFQMLGSTETPDADKLKNPQVIESQNYAETDGKKKDKIVLIQGEKSSNPQSELIILLKDDKIAWALNAADKETFDEIRAKFKQAVPETAGTEAEAPESMLRDISNFAISDIWNHGFVNVASFISSGTSATGESMDIDFTVEQLGKAMEKKVEYDSYMNGLDAKYDSVKKIWIKLSAETDRLYKQIQDKPPVANDSASKLDAGILNQYLDAFTAEVDNLNKQ